MLQLTDDQRALRARIAELEDTVTSLNQQLLQAQEVSVSSFSGDNDCICWWMRHTPA